MSENKFAKLATLDSYRGCIPNRISLTSVFIILPYFKGGSLHEEFLDSPRSACFINESQIFLSKGKNIFGILVYYWG